MEPVCKHLDFWNSTKEQYTNTWTFGTQLIKINGIAEPLLKKLTHLNLWNLLKIMNEIVDQIIKNPIQMLGLLEPN